MKNIDLRHNESNEIYKYRFFECLEHSEGKDPKTIDQFINAIHEFELAIQFRGFTKFNQQDAITFKHYLKQRKNLRTGEPISKSMFCNYCGCLKVFFTWLMNEVKEFSKLKPSQIKYFNPTKNDLNKAKAMNFQESHKVEDILSTIRKMPEETIIEKRNKAIFSLSLMTNARISSLQTCTIGSIRYFEDYDCWVFIQNPKKQNTKYARNITTFFVGNCPDIIQNVVEWREYLLSQGFCNKDYMFVRIDKPFKSNTETEYKLTKELIKSQTVIREVFEKAYSGNGLKYIVPHNIRHSITRFVQSNHNSVEMNIALSENFGHKSGMSTLVNSYGGNYLDAQAKLIKSINFEGC